MKILVFLLAAAAVPGWAQVSAFPNLPTSLVTYLSLTPDQVRDIRQVNIAFSEYIDAQYERSFGLEDDIDAELEKDNPSAFAVGQAMVDIVMIDREVKQEARTSIAKVQALLSAEQKQKIKVLEEAMSLTGTIHQAMGWLILAPSDDFPLFLLDSAPVSKRMAKLRPWLARKAVKK